MHSRMAQAMLLLSVLASGVIADENGVVTNSDCPPPVVYFNPVDQTKPPPNDFMLHVSDVFPEGPAWAAGLRPGDVVVGIDGKRVRSESEMHMLLRSEAPSARLVLQVNRSGQWREVVLNHTLAGRKGMFKVFEDHVDTVKALVKWGVPMQALPGHDRNLASGEPLPIPTAEMIATASPRKRPGGLIGGFLEPSKWEEEDDDNEYRKVMSRYQRGAQPWFFLNNSSARMREALCQLAASGEADDREWVGSFVQSVNLLLQSRYAEALDVLPVLAKRRTGTFLDDLVDFYHAVAKADGKFSGDDDWRKCGVDADFFAACYPYPTIPWKTSEDAFSCDPVYREAYRKTMGTPGNYDRELGKSIRWRETTDSPPEEFYVNAVLTSFIDWCNHSGWPVRYPGVCGVEPAKKFIEKLQKRWDDNPEARLTTAFAMLAPALISQQPERLRPALHEIYQYGTLETALANQIMSSVVRYYGTYVIEWYDVWVEEDRKAYPRPPVYGYLVGMEPMLGIVDSEGFYRAEYNSVSDFSNFLQSHSWLVSEALRRPEHVERLSSAIRAAQDGKARTMDEKIALFDQMSEVVCRWSSQTQCSQYVKYAVENEIPIPLVLKRFAEIISSHVDYRTIGFFDEQLGVAIHWRPWMLNVQSATMAEAVRAAGRINAGENVQTVLEESLPKAGTPLGMLLLASAAEKAGDLDSAGLLVKQATEFLEVGSLGDRWDALHAAIIMLSVPGQERMASAFFRPSRGSGNESVYLVGAFLDFRRQDYASARRQLEQARSIKKKDDLHALRSIWWDGEEFSKAAFIARLDERLSALGFSAPVGAAAGENPVGSDKVAP